MRSSAARRESCAPSRIPRKPTPSSQSARGRLKPEPPEDKIFGQVHGKREESGESHEEQHREDAYSLDDPSEDAQKGKDDDGRSRGDEDAPARPGIPEMTPLAHKIDPELTGENEHQQNKAAQPFNRQMEEVPANQ